MKTDITAQQLSYFKNNGHIRFDNFPLDFEHILAAADQSKDKRDLWRHSPPLEKMIRRTLSPLALAITAKKAVRLVSDQWLEAEPPLTRMQDLFCFQGLILLCTLTSEALDFYEPSSLTSALSPKSYLVLFGLENTRFIENLKDPHAAALKKMGYGYGDALKNEFHPLIFSQ